MEYQQMDFSSLIGTEGFSEKQLTVHFGLYGGYVKNTNLLSEKLKSIEAGTPEYAELKRRFGWEFNGMRLHELYFENMTKEDSSPDENSDFYKKIVDQFGSFDAFLADFKSTGSLRGIGWTILAYDRRGDKFFNVWINEHDVGHLAGAEPILVMDVFEHAFVFDYGMNRGEYITAFMNAVDWSVVAGRV